MSIAMSPLDNKLQNVYTVQYHGNPRNHIAIFVRPAETAPEASGKCFHVIGTTLAGMTLEVRDRESPLVVPDYVPGHHEPYRHRGDG